MKLVSSRSNAWLILNPCFVALVSRPILGFRFFLKISKLQFTYNLISFENQGNKKVKIKMTSPFMQIIFYASFFKKFFFLSYLLASTSLESLHKVSWILWWWRSKLLKNFQLFSSINHVVLGVTYVYLKIWCT